MRRTLFVAALAVLGACDHHHGIGTLGGDAGVGEAGAGPSPKRDAGGDAPSTPGSAVDAQISPPPFDAGAGPSPNWDAGGGTPIAPDGGVDAQIAPKRDTGGGTPITPDSGVDAQIVPNDAGAAPKRDTGGGTPITPDSGMDAQVSLPKLDAGSFAGADGSPGTANPLGQGPTSWTGYIENYQFASGSDVIRFTSTVDSAGQVMVTVFLGNGVPPPPATDPNVAYPPGISADPRMPLGNSSWAEGFAYTMTSGTFSSQRLRFTINTSQLWLEWCALQTPVDDSGACLPNWGGSFSSNECYQQNPATGQNIPVDCGKFNLCILAHVCTCSTTACVTDPSSGSTASFDLALSGPAANGSVTGLITERANVHFTLDPP